MVNLVILGEVKRSNIIKVQLQDKVQRFVYQNVFVFSQIRYKTYQTELSLCRLGHAPGVGLGVLGVKNLSFLDLRWRPSTVGSSYIVYNAYKAKHAWYTGVYIRNPYPWSLKISTL